MNLTGQQSDAAAVLVTREREASARRVSERLARTGTVMCVDCEEPIDEARKAAMPSAMRCAECQCASESGGGGW